MNTKKQLTSHEVEFRFICHTCGASGKWHPEQEPADQEADAHARQHPGHDADVEIKHTVLSRNNFIRWPASL